MSITAVSVAKDLKWVVMDLLVSAREDDGLQYYGELEGVLFNLYVKDKA